MSTDQLRAIYSEVQQVERHVSEFLQEHAGAVDAVHPNYRTSGANLLAYVALRQLDLRKLQLELGEFGLSSLGRCEGHVRSSLRELLARLEDTLRIEHPGAVDDPDPLSGARAEELLHTHTRALFGERPEQRHVFIMVTAPDEPPSGEECEALIGAGMNVLRINTAHGTPESWRDTAAVVRKVATRMDRRIAILIDLQGPKIRTAPMEDGPSVVRYRPEKDALGRVVRTLRVPVLGIGAPAVRIEGEAPAPLRVPDAWIAGFRVGDAIATRDTLERRRTFRLTEVGTGAAAAELDRTCYLTPASELEWSRDGEVLGRAPVSDILPRPGHVTLAVGDTVHISLDAAPGRAGVRHPADERSWLVPPRIGLNLAGVTIDLRPEQRVLLDDGKVEAVIDKVEGTVAQARVVKAAGRTVKIRAEKGVNFPDSQVQASALSDRDREVLPLVLELADVVGVSFVRTPADVREAIQVIRGAGERPNLSIVIKLETAYALVSLPDLLLEALREYPVGVMVARGDLAVEVGFERLAELQQEILWFAEAAHMPVVWATQVLDNLARTGIPSRAEISDASMSVQAECVMLNKGPFVVEACRTLDAIVRRMEEHQYKKRNLYRSLKIALASV